MKILFTTQALTIGGIEVLALRFSEAFAKAGHDVILYDFNPDLQNKGLLSKFDTSAFRLEYINRAKPLKDKLQWKLNAALGRTGLMSDFRQRRVEADFGRLIAEERPDVICSLSFHQDYLACRFAAPLGIPVVVSMHGIYEHAAPEWPERARFIHDHAAAIIYAADKNMEWYRNQPYFNPALPAFKIYTGTDLASPVPRTVSRQDLGIPEDAFVFIMVARGIREKGWLEAILAFREVHDMAPGTALLLVGEGEYLRELKSRYETEAGVIFYGSHPASVELTVLADAGLLPSYFPVETMPNVIIDYLRCGLPVLASDIGEIPAMLSLPDDAVAGKILPRTPEGAVGVDALAAVMRALVSDPAYYRRLADASKTAARKFDIQDTVKRYMEVFNAAVKS
jgi:glycosyltransferase involved in cell wall biosynthesis